MPPTVEQMLARLKGYKMDVWEKRAQSISWVAGQLRCEREGADEWALRLEGAKFWEMIHGGGR